MKPPFRIAILECDTPVPKVYEKFGTYGTIFRGLLYAGADDLNVPGMISSKSGLEISAWDVINEQTYPRFEDVDAVLISGSSRSNENGNFPKSASTLTEGQSTIPLRTTLGS